MYILTNRPRGTLYVGVTGNLHRRLSEHRSGSGQGFTSRYRLTRLVWFVEGASIAEAITVEKKLKNRGRQWKIDLIEKRNPEWRDLSEQWE
ncbi:MULTISPECIES: GIY-YIG nuclease family protein [unclassified Leucobacter]|uniref:GIY-YIG nuclease family protein n=1 Tax=unclassified Leucobacter TaxID=2621730 RepID=UPI0018ED9D96|nr:MULTISPECIES: GIY-YIG nuclease family protein [unclassified Leucobacter]